MSITQTFYSLKFGMIMTCMKTLSFYIESSEVGHGGLTGSVFIHNLTDECIAVELLKNANPIVSIVHLCPIDIET